MPARRTTTKKKATVRKRPGASRSNHKERPFGRVKRVIERLPPKARMPIIQIIGDFDPLNQKYAPSI